MTKFLTFVCLMLLVSFVDTPLVLHSAPDPPRVAFTCIGNIDSVTNGTLHFITSSGNHTIRTLWDDENGIGTYTFDSVPEWLNDTNVICSVVDPVMDVTYWSNPIHIIIIVNTQKVNITEQEVIMLNITNITNLTNYPNFNTSTTIEIIDLDEPLNNSTSTNSSSDIGSVLMGVFILGGVVVGVVGIVVGVVSTVVGVVIYCKIRKTTTGQVDLRNDNQVQEAPDPFNPPVEQGLELAERTAEPTVVTKRNLARTTTPPSCRADRAVENKTDGAAKADSSEESQSNHDISDPAKIPDGDEFDDKESHCEQNSGDNDENIYMPSDGEMQREGAAAEIMPGTSDNSPGSNSGEVEIVVVLSENSESSHHFLKIDGAQ